MGISAPSLFSQSPPWRYDTDQKNRAQIATSQTVGGAWGGKGSVQHRLSVRGHSAGGRFLSSLPRTNVSNEF